MKIIDCMSPGKSWYESNISSRTCYPVLQENTKCDVLIIGGGFTGSSAAYHLAKSGINVILIEKNRFGSGASGRNGGQIGTGQRHWVSDLEKIYGFERTKILFDISERAKHYLIDFTKKSKIDMEYKNGHISVSEKKRHYLSWKSHIKNMEKYGYENLFFMEKEETSNHLGSNFYSFGIRDTGTGHINPLKLIIGTIQEAENVGARLFENTNVLSIKKKSNKISIETSYGIVDTQKVLIATNGYNNKFASEISKYVLPIISFIAATEPLNHMNYILPGWESVDCSRFAVRYFRKSINNQLLFGGSEIYNHFIPKNIERKLRHQLKEIYPELSNVSFTHIWGGTIGITVQRLPFVKEIKPGILYCGGYSGHGIMLSHFFGSLYASSILGDKDYLKHIKDLKISRFPGGKLRNPILFILMKLLSFFDKF